MSKHTPGPWQIGGRTILRPTLTIFHKPFGLGDVAEVYEEADARLIAAGRKIDRAAARIEDAIWAAEMEDQAELADREGWKEDAR